MCDLNDKVTSKLDLHNIALKVTTVYVKYDKGQSVEFGTWAEFMSHDWKTGNVTTEVNLRWDFLISLPSFSAPQRHTLTVRISETPNPLDFMRVLFSQDLEAGLDMDAQFACCVARVDFISHRLAGELTDVVEEWNDSLREPSHLPAWLAKLRHRGHWVAAFIRFLLPVLVTLLLLAVLPHAIPDTEGAPVSPAALVTASRWVLVSILLLYLATRLGSHMADQCLSTIHGFSLPSPFRMTRGDENQAAANAQKNSRKLLKLVLNAALALALNLIAGYAIWYFTTH